MGWLLVKTSNRFWVLLFGAILVVSAVAAYTLSLAPVERAYIYQDRVFIASYDLSRINEPDSLVLDNGFGLNVIDIERGRIRVSEADCPDGLCVRQGWVSGGMIPIVCLPHRLVIRFDSNDMADVDAVTR